MERITINARCGGKKHMLDTIRRQNITYCELFNKFMDLNNNLKSNISDYRPYGDFTIILYFKNGVSMIVEYDPINDSFEILRVDHV